MPDFGWTDAGFVAKPLSVIKAELEADWIAIYGPNADIGPETLAGQEIGLIAGMFDDHWQTTAEGVSQLDPSRSQGTLQSSMVQLNGIRRQDESNTAQVAEVTGVAAQTLLAGAVAETTVGDRFILQGDVVFTGGADTSNWLAEEVGPVPCAVGTLTIISTPKTGWLTITNGSGPTVLGTFEEQDGTLRRRREVTTETGAVNMFIAMQSALNALDGVTDVKLLENDTDAADGNGLPEHSVRAIVEGGDDDEIAQAIWDTRAAGIAFSGTDDGNAVDRDGNPQVVDFSRPVLVPIHIAIVLATNAEFPADGNDQMKQAILDFNAGTLVKPGCLEGDEERFFDGTVIGQDSEYSSQYTPINSIPGHTVTSYTMSRVNNPPLVSEVSDVSITDLEKAQYLITNIDII